MLRTTPITIGRTRAMIEFVIGGIILVCVLGLLTVQPDSTPLAQNNPDLGPDGIDPNDPPEQGN